MLNINAITSFQKSSEPASVRRSCIHFRHPIARTLSLISFRAITRRHCSLPTILAPTPPTNRAYSYRVFPISNIVTRPFRSPLHLCQCYRRFLLSIPFVTVTTVTTRMTTNVSVRNFPTLCSVCTVTAARVHARAVHLTRSPARLGERLGERRSERRSRIVRPASIRSCYANAVRVYGTEYAAEQQSSRSLQDRILVGGRQP